jgi:hypothetical protein
MNNNINKLNNCKPNDVDNICLAAKLNDYKNNINN